MSEGGGLAGMSVMMSMNARWWGEQQTMGRPCFCRAQWLCGNMSWR